MGYFLGALVQTTQDTKPHIIILLMGLGFIVIGCFALRSAVLKLRGDPRAWMGRDHASKGPGDMFPRTISIAAWAYAFLFIVGGIGAVIAYLSGGY